METIQLPISKVFPNIGQIEGLPKNPRFVKDAKYKLLVQSIKDDPEMLELRELIVYDTDTDNGYVVIGGNMRYRAMKELGYTKMPCKVLPTGFPVDKMRRIVLKDNSSYGETDFKALVDEWNMDEIELAAIEVPILETSSVDNMVASMTKNEAPKENRAETKPIVEALDDPIEEDDEFLEDEIEDECSDEKEQEKHSYYKDMLGDFLYDSDNHLEIPNLLITEQPKHVELPLTPWGANSRLSKDVNTYHFYVDDYRFEAILRDPVKLVLSGCRQIVEPNCSCHDQTPIAHGISLIYKKRYLARYMQECGVKVWVDLNVSHKFKEYNKMGVPKGYNAFFTRGLDGWLESLKIDLETAQEISGLDKPNLCVYGGGKSIQSFCQEHGLVYITDFINAKKIDYGKK